MFKKRLMFTEEMIKAVKFLKLEKNRITAVLKLTPAAATYFGIEVEAFVLKGIWDPQKDKCKGVVEIKETGYSEIFPFCQCEQEVIQNAMEAYSWEFYNTSLLLLHQSIFAEDVGICMIDSKDPKLAIIERDSTRNGFCFKSYKNYVNHPKEPCYVPETTDTVYTAESFLDICRGQKEFADFLFQKCDWQHPEALLDKFIQEEEWVICPKCEKLVSYLGGEGDTECPICGEEIEDDF